jgi:para-aminobenzoate synthetase/4-amino-4-deoxychorismate lyase
LTRPAPTEIARRRLDLRADPLDVLRRFRGRDRLVALVGAWHHGEALIAFDPVEVLDGDSTEGIDAIDVEPVPAGAGFGGGWIGAWGYQLGRLLERVDAPAVRPYPQPAHRLGFYDHVLRLCDGTWWLESLTPDAERDARILDVLAEPPPAPRLHDVGAFSMTPTPDQHRAAVDRVLEHVAAGDIFQANLCARLEAPFSGDPLDVFCAGVSRLGPAYAAYVDSPDGTLVSLSPELFLRRTGSEVLTSPIKGTAPLTSDPDELVASAKDRAENVMIVDLMRNDLGRVCVPGSVRVPSLVRAERHAVWHLVSDVVGHLEPGVRDSDLLRATFPPGSVTGAPKVRAMQIVSALEATGREAYTGAIGHVSPGVGLELSVVIRTFEFPATRDRVWLGVGGGIVIDSTPDREYAECLVKARPLIDAIGGVLDLVADAPPPVEVVPDAAVVAAPRPDETLGVYDTLLVHDGHVVDLDAHLARLDASVRAVYGHPIRGGLDEAVVRRAAGLRGRHRLRVDAVPSSSGTVDVTMTVRPLDPAGDTWTLEPRTVPDGLGQHKWVDRTSIQHDGPPDHDLLLVAQDGSVLETSRASLFVVHDDAVLTPPVDGRILPGTARERVVEILREAGAGAGVPLVQRRLTLADLAAATEVFATNALRGVVPVTACRDVGEWPVGRTTSWLRDELQRRWDPAAPAPAPAPSPAAASVRRPRSSSSSRARVLFIDNYDSFVYNLVQYAGELGATTTIVRNDEVTVDELVARRAAGDLTHLVVSPGPGTPADAGISREAVRRLGPTTPTLGVCLGHQAIAEVYGAAVVRAPEIVHGKPSLVHHDGRGVYAGLPSPLACARYHSLVADPATLPDELEVTARTASGLVMGLRHRTHPVEGVQMHPESILTSRGHDMLHTFLTT